MTKLVRANQIKKLENEDDDLEYGFGEIYMTKEIKDTSIYNGLGIVWLGMDKIKNSLVYYVEFHLIKCDEKKPLKSINIHKKNGEKVGCLSGDLQKENYKTGNYKTGKKYILTGRCDKGLMSNYRMEDMYVSITNEDYPEGLFIGDIKAI